MPEIKSVALITMRFDDYIYFNSREENRAKETIPVLHNIALQYAMKNVATPSYRIHSFVPSYLSDFKSMKRPIYIYPALPSRVTLAGNKMNISPAMPETSMMKIGWQTDDYRSFSEQTRVNLLQFSDIKVLDPGNTFVTFATSSLSFDEVAKSIPSIITIGKFNGKARVDVQRVDFYPARDTGDYRLTTPWLINPVDLPPGLKIGRDYTASLIRMNPNDLLRGIAFKRFVPSIRFEHIKDMTLPICQHFQGVIAA